MAEQADAVQRVAQLGELFVDEGADLASLMPVQETLDRGTMARRDPFIGLVALGIPPFREPCAVEQLIGHSLEGGDDNDRRRAVHGIQDDSPDVPDAVGRGERRSAELEHPHAEPRQLSRSVDTRIASKSGLGSSIGAAIRRE